jgi:hypothetical protein
MFGALLFSCAIFNVSGNSFCDVTFEELIDVTTRIFVLIFKWRFKRDVPVCATQRLLNFLLVTTFRSIKLLFYGKPI